MYRKTHTATIAAAGSLSDAISLEGMTVVALILPAVWTAAELTFQASVDGTNFYEMYDMTAVITTATASASRWISLEDSPEWMGVSALKIRSGTAAVPVAQAAERLITVVTADI